MRRLSARTTGRQDTKDPPQECEGVLAIDYEWEAFKGHIYSDGGHNVYLTFSGSFKETGVRMPVTDYARMWMVIPKDESTYYTISGGLSPRTPAFCVRTGAGPGLGSTVRCVRER